ncbi:MAG: hypothetical protein HYR72_06860 [Deltaproteobacteria bacterium]|nr:hypothetical protein [Deltaproteobacteria bacterium]MBI3387167.1 hypothetical protein [Deltaproteobacteria bacterium]
MATRTSMPHSAMYEILTAMVKGTKKMKGEDFFWEAVNRFHHYKPAKHAELTDWLKKAGIRKLPTPEQCVAARKLASKAENATLSIYGPETRNY